MDPAVLAAFTVVAAGLVILPGPDWALVLAAGSGGGSRPAGHSVTATIAGLMVGYSVLTAAVAAGIAPLAAAVPGFLVGITLVGACYLLVLGVRMLRPSTTTTWGDDIGPSTARAAMLRGVGVSALNPKSVIFFIAFLPQFARPEDPWPLSVQLLALGAIWVGLITIVYTVVGHGTRGAFARHPRLAVVINRIAGVAMVLAGTALLAEPLLRTHA